MNIGLFFGSFNPIHIGHLIIANIVHETTEMDQVWFIVSPQNPLKGNKNLLHEFDRYDLVEAAITEDYHFKVSDVEFNLPRPNYTVQTLTVLAQKYPDHNFNLIIGEDNLAALPRWKNYNQILENFGLIVYPRPNAPDSDLRDHPSVKLIDAPRMDISATLIRNLLKQNKSIKYLVPERVRQRIEAKKLFV